MTYVVYNDEREIRGLDLNNVPVVDDEYSVFPQNIYSRPLFSQPQYFYGSRCDNPTGRPLPRRSGKGAYVSKSWVDLPERFSRFSVDNFDNGYGNGRAGYGYVTPPQCQTGEPPGMALPRFYRKKCDWVRN